MNERQKAGPRTWATCECGDHCFAALTKGFIAFVSPSDVESVDKWSWTSAVRRTTVYAQRTDGRTTVRMHNAVTGKNYIDHVDGNGLNNRKGNLRPASGALNNAARINQKPAKTGYRGVHPTPAGKFVIAIGSGDTMRREYGFNSAFDAAKRRDEIAKQMYGEFAYLNFPEAR